MLPKKAVIEFQRIYEEKLGIKLTLSEATEKSENFIQLFDLVTNKKIEDEKPQPSLRAETSH